MSKLLPIRESASCDIDFSYVALGLRDDASIDFFLCARYGERRLLPGDSVLICRVPPLFPERLGSRVLF